MDLHPHTFTRTHIQQLGQPQTLEREPSHLYAYRLRESVGPTDAPRSVVPAAAAPPPSLKPISSHRILRGVESNKHRLKQAAGETVTVARNGKGPTTPSAQNNMSCNSGASFIGPLDLFGVASGPGSECDMQRLYQQDGDPSISQEQRDDLDDRQPPPTNANTRYHDVSPISGRSTATAVSGDASGPSSSRDPINTPVRPPHSGPRNNKNTVATTSSRFQHQQRHLDTSLSNQYHQSAHLNIDHHPHSVDTTATASITDSPAFMYDDDSLVLQSSQPPARFLDEALPDPNVRDDDSDPGLLRHSHSSHLLVLSHDLDDSYTTSHTTISSRGVVSTPHLEHESSSHDIHQDFAKFIENGRRAATTSAAAKAKAEIQAHYNELIAANASNDLPSPGPDPPAKDPVTVGLGTVAATSTQGGKNSKTDPQYQKFVNAMSGIYNLTDQQLEDRFLFEQEIGYGNWGSVWKCALRESANGSGSRLGRVAAMNGGIGAQGRVAVKLAHRSKEAANTQRVHALWHEMKIIRSLRHDTHPSIIEFEAFVITPGYALIVMPYLNEPIELKISVTRARPYFRALASAVGYLHERGICHNDIKPANVVVGHNDVPVLVDFGFAKKHELGSPGRFLSTTRMGTPEYLDPQRVVGQPHDERASDVWSLGITFYEILIGRTPFEKSEEEVFSDEDLPEYWHRTRAGQWLGDWDMPPQMESLMRYMICPDPVHRISALQAYHHPALQPSKESVNAVSPSFVREAMYQPNSETLDSYAQLHPRKLKNVKSDVGGVRKKKEPRGEREVTPLGESIKQHTSNHELRSANARDGPPKKKTKIVMVRNRAERKSPLTDKVKQRVHEIEKENNKQIRVSNSEHIEMPGAVAAATRLNGALTVSPDVSHADVSSISEADIICVSPMPARSRQEAMLRTLRNLEGNEAMTKARKQELQVAAQRQIIPMQSFEAAATREEAVSRAFMMLEGGKGVKVKTKVACKSEENILSADRSTRSRSPSGRRPQSSDAATMLSKPASKGDIRRSEGTDGLAMLAHARASTPQRHSRYNSIAPVLDVNISTGTIFPPSLNGCGRVADGVAMRRDSSVHGSPLRGGGGAQPVEGSPARRAKQSTGPDAVGLKDDNLDRLADWAKAIEHYVEVARRARAEGRPEPPMPAEFGEHFGTLSMRPMSPVAQVVARCIQADFGQTPASQPGHTHANQPIHNTVPEKRYSRRHELPTVSQLFHRRNEDKDKDKKNGPVLRRMAARIPTRKSEPQLNMTVVATKPTPTTSRTHPDVRIADEEKTEELRSSWRNSRPSGNLLSPPVQYSMLAATAPDGTRMNKPSSMVSLREKARAFLGDKERHGQQTQPHARTHTQTLPRTKSEQLLRDHRQPKENSQSSGGSASASASASSTSGGRPQTPGANSVFGTKERKGIFKLFKRG